MQTKWKSIQPKNIQSNDYDFSKDSAKVNGKPQLNKIQRKDF